MKNSPTTLFGVYQKFASKNKTSFSDWCAFVAWVKKFSPDVDVLNSLDELTPEAYEAVCNPTPAAPPDPLADAEQPTVPDVRSRDEPSADPEQPITLADELDAIVAPQAEPDPSSDMNRRGRSGKSKDAKWQ